jgi:putative ABC transport system permease protein
MRAIFDGRSAQMGDMSLNIQFFTPNPETSKINAATVREISYHLQAFPNAEVNGMGSKIFSLAGADIPAAVHREQDIATLIILEPALYERLAEHTGVISGTNILINVALEKDRQGNFVQYNPFDDLTGYTLSLYPFMFSPRDDEGTEWITNVHDTSFDISIDGQITRLPDDLLILASPSMTVIMPELSFTNYQWAVSTDDPVGFMQYANNFFDNYITLQDGEAIGLMDVMDELEITIAVINFFTAFVSIFSFMIALLGLTNVISTIMTNIQLRAREFAILTSIGMTKGGIGRMLKLESLMGSIRSLIFGLPLGIAMAWLIYHGISLMFGHFFSFAFIIPWLAIIACVLGVFIITFAIMRYSASNVSRGNTIETIRNTVI